MFGQHRESRRPRTRAIGLIDKRKTRYRERLRIALRASNRSWASNRSKATRRPNKQMLKMPGAKWRLAFALSRFAVIP